MPYLHQRRNLRLPKRDYSRGIYLITLCAENDGAVFGAVIDGKMHLNAVGEIVAESWTWLAARYSHVTLDEWVVMPDHFHALIILADPKPLSGASTVVVGRRKPLGQLIGAFKTVSTKAVNQARNTPGAKLWQRDFWERVVRNNGSLPRFRQYIRNNPAALSTSATASVGARS